MENILQLDHFDYDGKHFLILGLNIWKDSLDKLQMILVGNLVNGSKHVISNPFAASKDQTNSAAISSDWFGIAAISIKYMRERTWAMTEEYFSKKRSRS